MRIDSHQHFWEYNERDYAWMGPEHEAIRRDYLPPVLEPLLDSIEFDGSIAVQARQMVEETDFLLGLADQHARVLGVVGWLDLRSDNIAEQIARYAGHPKFVGVRHVVHDEPDDRFVLGEAFQHGLRMLEPAGLTYDLLLFPRHIRPSITLADAFPNQPFVIDHIAKPPIAAGETEPWKIGMRDIARRPNVTCKLSGMVTEANHASWEPAQFEHYLDTVLEAFGPERLMIGSDWPVCTLAGAYQPVMRIVLDYVDRLTPDERGAILGQTCARFYGVLAPGSGRPE